MNGSDRCKRTTPSGRCQRLPLAEVISRLQTENASLQRRLDRRRRPGAGRHGRTPTAPPTATTTRSAATRGSAICRHRHRRTIVEVKKEKADAEGARTNSTATTPQSARRSSASTAAATAAADAREAAREAARELVDVHDDFVNRRRGGSPNARSRRRSTSRAPSPPRLILSRPTRSRTGRTERRAPCVMPCKNKCRP